MPAPRQLQTHLASEVILHTITASIRRGAAAWACCRPFRSRLTSFCCSLEYRWSRWFTTFTSLFCIAARPQSEIKLSNSLCNSESCPQRDILSKELLSISHLHNFPRLSKSWWRLTNQFIQHFFSLFVFYEIFWAFFLHNALGIAARDFYFHWASVEC